MNRLVRLETLLPRLRIPRPEGDIDPWALFAVRPRALWLEIGFGGGEHLATQAHRHPEVGFIGCEVFINGIARALAHIEAGGLVNVRLFPDDVRLFLPTLPEGCLERVFLLFPDPWPKKRHAHRRFVAPANLGSPSPSPVRRRYATNRER
ncbi:MAG: tRNA (guanine-N7-)-methyltransferase [Rhodospirillaceae bacterium]|nr:MAG: tRNA (guanine-N7-)-methyltransferase [Rhodospirillaceae bacterium]